MRDRADVVVVGAGVIGSALAERLRQLGATVLLVDAGLAGEGTTGATFSWFNGSSKVRLKYPREYFVLNQVGMQYSYRLANELADGRWLHPIGNIEVVSGVGMEQLRTDVAELLARDYPVSMIDARTASELEPTLQMPSDSIAAFYPHEGWIDGPHMVKSLLDELRRNGGHVLESDAVVQLVVEHGRVVQAVLMSGTKIEADTFVLATGIDTMRLAGLVDANIPLVDRASPQAAGLLVHCHTPSSAASVHRIVHVNGVATRPNGNRRLLMVDIEGDPTLTAASSTDIQAVNADAALRRAREALPVLHDASITSTVMGVRALPMDRISIVGYAPGVDGLYVAVTHSGITLAAYLAHLAASEILRGDNQSALDPFRPGRFIRSDSAPATVVQ